MAVGEISGSLDFYETMKYVSKDRKELSMVFHFGHLRIVRKAPFFIATTRLISLRTRAQKANGIFESGTLQN